jgi:hypothetical protein
MLTEQSDPTGTRDLAATPRRLDRKVRFGERAAPTLVIRYLD